MDRFIGVRKVPFLGWGVIDTTVTDLVHEANAEPRRVHIDKHRRMDQAMSVFDEMQLQLREAGDDIEKLTILQCTV